MSDRYVVRKVVGGAKSLAETVTTCPPNYKLHSVIPTASTQHGTDGFIVVFEERDFGSEG